MDDSIKRQDAIDALWKALYDYEDKTEKQFLESEELNTDDWFRHRIFVQNMSDIDRQTILNLPSAQKKGHWVQNDNGTWSCSNCQSWILNEQHYYARFCLHCGADMREER